jgi:hypothetical protein
MRSPMVSEMSAILVVTNYGRLRREPPKIRTTHDKDSLKPGRSKPKDGEDRIHHTPPARTETTWLGRRFCSDSSPCEPIPSLVCDKSKIAGDHECENRELPRTREVLLVEKQSAGDSTGQRSYGSPVA